MEHNGTQQRDRLLLSLLPDQLKIDDRSIEELIAFAGTLATHVRYWNDNNQEGGDWLPFWESDLTSLLALLAATDLEGPRTGYRDKELEYKRRKKKQEEGVEASPNAIIDEMVASVDFGIYGLALRVLNICNKLPVGHPLKTDVANLITGSLKDSLYRLIQFHKAIDPQAIQKYSGFIGGGVCAAPWSLPDNGAFECIDFVLPYEHVGDLWKLFLNFYNALNIILQKIKKAFQSILRTRHNHQPHVALFIAFLYLFKYLQEDLNGLTEKHLFFFYHDVLRLERRRVIPDKVHIVFEIATNLTRYRLQKGIALKGGADTAGNERTYLLEDELVISNVKLVEIKNLYATETMVGDNKLHRAIVLPAADKRDGLEEAWPAGTKAWRALSGEAVYNRILYKIDQLKKIENKLDGQPLPSAFREEAQRYQALLRKLEAFSGFSISSAELWLNKGVTRAIILTFEFPPGQQQSLLDEYEAEISTEKGLIPLKRSMAEGALEIQEILTGRIFGAGADTMTSDEGDPTYEAYNRIIAIDNKRYIIAMHAKFPSVHPLDDYTPPFVRFRSKGFETTFKGAQSVQVASFAMGTLNHYKTSKDAALLFKQTATGFEAGSDVVIDPSADQQEIIVKVPEIFAKNMKTVRVVAKVQNPITFLLHNDQWIDATSDINIPDYKDGEGLLAGPGDFNFKGRSNANGWLKMRFTYNPANGQPMVLRAEEVFVQYRSLDVTIPARNSGRSPLRHFLGYFTTLGDWAADPEMAKGLRSKPTIEQPMLKPLLSLKALRIAAKDQPIAHGNLFLGFEHLVPDQTLSLLFKTADGTANPDHYAPEIVWSYLRNNEWFQIPPQFILKDTTLGLQQTGIVLFQIPTDINNNNTWIKGKGNRRDLYWLRASAIEIPDDLIFVDALPTLIDIHVNAAEAMFVNDNNMEDHLDPGLPAETISALQLSDVNVQRITQPYVSFQGRPSEKSDRDGYMRRIHERLRHRNRAVTLWDYERLVLEAFPKVAVIKCLTHTRRVYTARPGYVTLAAIPHPDKMIGNGKYHPAFNAGELKAIKNFIKKRNTYFVGGYGDPEFCCCEDDCQCDHDDNRLEVINARFEPIRLKVCVRFYEGRDIPYYTKALNEALKNFLAPWANERRNLLFGVPVSTTRLLQFLETLDYVDVILGLQVKHFRTAEIADHYEENVPWETPRNRDTIVPFTAASVLTTYLDKLNEDNPNVIDHVINVVATHERCSCEGCRDEDGNDNDDGPVDNPVRRDDEAVTPEARDNMVATLRRYLSSRWRQQPRNITAVIKNYREELHRWIDDGKLKGTKPANVELGEEGTHAYRIEKVKVNNRIVSLNVSVAFEPGHFTTFSVNHPNP